MSPTPAPLWATDPPAIGAYRLIGRLGAGGQGTVFLAEPEYGGPRVAIKRLSAEALDDPRVRPRFAREAEAARQVASFCTAAVLTADFESQPPYIVSEYVEGPSLQQRIRQDGPMAGDDLTRLAVATVTALVAIHEAGIVHRDFKPGNVLLGTGGARVIDFGIAQITDGTGTRTDSISGTPAFMAPEQIAGSPAATAADVFAWGAVIAYAATGASPFAAGSVPAVLHRVLHAEPDTGPLPEPLRTLVPAALAKDAEARPAAVDLLMALLGRSGASSDAASLNQALHDAETVLLDGAATTLPAPPAAESRPGPTGAPARRSRWLLGLGAAAVAALLVAAGAFFADAWPPGGGADQPVGSAGAGAGVARFTEEEAGDWEGLAETGTLIEISIAAGERTADIEADGDGCSTEAKLVSSTDSGYRANIALGGLEPASCVSSTFYEISDQAEMAFDGDTLTIGFFEADTGSEPRTTVALARVDG